MSNLNGIPSADYFETILTNMWNGTTGTVYVSAVPSGTLPNDEYSYIVVNPGEVNMQVAKVDGWDSDNKTFNVIDVDIPSGVDTVYTAKTHPLGSKVRFSNNYVFWKEIQEAINSKLDGASLSPVATSGDYDDLINKPVLSAVALSNDYNDLDNLPTPITVAVGDKVLELTSGELSATISASYDNGTKKITLYGVNSAVISEIDCTEFIKDGMIQNVQIVTDPVGYPAGKYLEFDFNTDSGVTDIYIPLSDFAVYTAGTGIDITSNAITLKKATTNSLGGVIVGSGLSVNDGTISADSQTDENYTTAEKNKLSCIESNAQVNVIEDVKVNGNNLTVCNKAVDIELKTINGASITGTGDLDIMARQYTAGTGISISCTDEISISTAYQNTINCKANCSDLSPVATSGLYCDLCGTPSACDYDIKDLSDICCCRNKRDGKQDTLVSGTTIKTINGCDLLGSGNICISGGGGSGDMLASTYDPLGCNGDAFDYCNFHNTPTIPTDNCQLANGCGYTTCTGTLVAADLNGYATTSSLCAVATSGKYCDLTGTPTIPTNNNQLTNGCGYTTCTGTVSSCSDVISALGYTPYNSSNPNGYTSCTGTLQSCDIATVNGCCLTSGGNICITGGSDYSRCTKTISGGEVEIGLRTIVDPPTSDFTLKVPATIKEGEEYVIRTISETSYCMCLGSCITNPRNVDTCLSGNATDQYVFLAINGELELQPLSACGS